MYLLQIVMSLAGMPKSYYLMIGNIGSHLIVFKWTVNILVVQCGITIIIIMLEESQFI